MNPGHAGPRASSNSDHKVVTRMPMQGDEDALAPVERHIATGALHVAMTALLPALDRSGAAGNRICALAAQLLRAQDEAASPARQDALAAALDRLVALTQRQEEQIRALLAMVEDGL